MEAAIITALLVSLGCYGTIEVRQRRRGQADWQTVQLHFGRDITPEAVVAVLDRLSGLPQGATVVFEAHADHRGISHFLTTDKATLQSLRGSLSALLPGLRLTPPVEATKDSALRYGHSVRLRGRLRVLRQDGMTEASAGLLAAMQPLSEGEHLLIRWLIAAGRPQPLPEGTGKNGQTIPAEHRRLLRAKNEGGVVRARGLLAVGATHPKRASHLLGRLTAVLRTRSTAYGHLRTLPLPAWRLPRALASRHVLFADRYSSAELAGLLAWPVDGPALPGLSLGTSPLLMPSARLPREGRVLGTATWPGEERSIAQPVLGALSHSLIAGPTGTGKSTLLTNLMLTDIAAGHGAVLIDGKGDSAAEALARLPKERRDDVVVLDCGAEGRQPGIGLFGKGNVELAADVVLGVISDLFADSWGVLSERYLRAGLLAVAHDPKGTLADVPYVYTDPAYRRQLVGSLRDPLTRSTFAAFEAMKPAERQHQLSAAFNKLGALLGRPIVRTVLGQGKPKLDFAEVLAAQKIVVISLSPARVGAPAARLIGALSVFALFQAVQSRIQLPERARRPFLVYIDEPRALGNLPMPLGALLEQARGLGVGVTLAPQSMSQLPKGIREAALTNAATRVVFRQHADDARLLARDLPDVDPEDLGDLAAYEAIARIGLGPGDVAPPVSLKTEPLSKPQADPQKLRVATANRWGATTAEVDAELEAKHRQSTQDAPVGRRRRMG